MKKIELPNELMEFICRKDKHIFINSCEGWEDEKSKLTGFQLGKGVDKESNTLFAENGKSFQPQGGTIHKGNHLLASYRVWDREKNKIRQIKEESLSSLPLFKDYEVVILTNNEILQCFAPVCSKKRELVQFMTLIEEYVEEMKEQGEEILWDLAGEFQELALFLYNNNPAKETKPTFF